MTFSNLSELACLVLEKIFPKSVSLSYQVKNKTTSKFIHYVLWLGLFVCLDFLSTIRKLL